MTQIDNVKKKGHPTFNVPNYGARSRSRVPERWRKQRGIDNKKRIKRNFMGAEPTIGYGNPKSIRGVRANGKRIMLVRNAKELERLVKGKALEGYDITIASSVSLRKRIEITHLAGKANLSVTNGAYK
ncbi:MAG: eL32 family ribosomal protein [Candidatus Micrarchaeaceae archaeon]|jgi:large subunit ribosomal protein L32e|nr:50S ribosomal protein L32e [Candidatus Micrarchaeota archaeon]HII09809.1 50S ribosomal protein L32e [Candidatus Micrarchaeota archaeon]